MVKNDKKFCLSYSITQESYLIWLSFMVHICKMIISPSFNFWVNSGAKGQKMVQNDKKAMLVLDVSENIHYL